ncbi:hypothetical protein JXL21_08850 [Candidatus Bathyarchaeota archaeon]|nr:hypothetical protein [Candidatus Bathyarchaeota archaeon]
MSGQKQCVFVAGRLCPFPDDKIPLQTCQICIEAWKTEVASRAQTGLAKPAPQQAVPLVGGDSLAAPASTHVELREIDELFKGNRIDPLEYVRLRKQHTEHLTVEDAPTLRIDFLDSYVEPEPRQIRVVVAVKSLFGNTVKTYPDGWSLPKAIGEKVINQIFKLADERPGVNLRVKVGDYKVACIRHAKGKLAFLVLDADEEFETYRDELKRLSHVFEGEKLWLRALKKMD